MQNFDYIDSTKQIIVTIAVESPPATGSYNVDISTFNGVK